MVKETDFKSWQVPELTDLEKGELLRNVEDAFQEKKRFHFGWAQVAVAAVLLLVVSLSVVFLKENAVDHKLSVVQGLLEKEVARHREYIYFVEKTPMELREEEELDEKDFHN